MKSARGCICDMLDFSGYNEYGFPVGPKCGLILLYSTLNPHTLYISCDAPDA